jgi:PilZ domain-containing protein
VRRLREHQLVTLELDQPSASIECLVLGIDGGEAALEPVDQAQLALMSTLGHNALLTFEYRSQLITLRGTARRDDIERDARFTVTDRVTVPQRRRYARVDVALPLRLVALGDDGAPAGETIETRTRDLSADGLLAEQLLPAGQSNWRLELEVPDNGPTVVCTAKIIRHVGGGTGMRYTAISAEDRQRLRQYVAARKRAILANLRKKES